VNKEIITMKVKATKLLYYGHKRRREGDIFEIEKSQDFSERSMIALEGFVPTSSKKKKSGKKEAASEEPIHGGTSTERDMI
jgi:hypothetical protein